MLGFAWQAALGALLLSADAKLEPHTQLNYQGNIALRAEDQAAKTRKSFDLTIWISRINKKEAEIFWLIDERGHGAWPWPQRFGRVMLDKNLIGGVRGPSLLYERSDGRSVIPLLLPFLDRRKKLAADARWQDDMLEYVVEKAGSQGGRDVWQIAVRDPYGLKRNIAVDQRLPVVTMLSERVTMDKGNEYQLQMELTGNQKLPGDKFAELKQAFLALVLLRNKLAHPLDSHEVDWKPAELMLLRGELARLEELARGTAIERLILSGKRDVDLQAGRVDAVAELVREHVGQQAPDFTLQDIDGNTVAKKDLAGKVTVLHFWDYRHEPLKEPYGQVGYLDFLYNRRKDAGLKVFGVAVDSRLGDPKAQASAMRGIRKLKDFMNLGYGILLDSGGALKAFGDPRLVGSTLPLFVVIDAQGKIIHYHVGHYPVRQDQGLVELDQAVASAGIR